MVDKLTAEAAAQEAALQAQKAAEAASLSRIAQLEEEQMHFEEQYSSVQVSQLQRHEDCCLLASFDSCTVSIQADALVQHVGQVLCFTVVSFVMHADVMLM